MNVRIVTTFNPAHWGLYVRRNLESMLAYLPYEIVVYYEGGDPWPLEHERLVWRKLQEVPGCSSFVAEARQFPPACGQFEKYDYNFDACKFSRKVYAQCDASEEPCDVLIWLDSDVEVLAPLSEGDIENLWNGMPIARFARNDYHSECGIVFWDMRTTAAKEFFRHYRHLYDSRRIYTLPYGWHDCWALDAVIDAMGMPTTNLSRHPDRLEVVSSSDLGAVFHHAKGIAKHVAA